jgi:hypothetical protein
VDGLLESKTALGSQRVYRGFSMTHNAGMRTSISTELRNELADIVTCRDRDGEDGNEDEEDSEEQTEHEEEEDEEEEDGEEGKVDKYYLARRPRTVRILERAETMGAGTTRCERPWEDVTHQFWTV